MPAKTKARAGKTLDVREIRRAIADYMSAEGCSCCRDQNRHDEAKARLAKMLNVPKYSDGSGYDFYRFKTKDAVR